MLTRRQTRQTTLQENVMNGPQMKRKAAESPLDATMQRKRSAFGDLTNALRNVQISSNKKSQLPVLSKPAKKNTRNRSLGRIVETRSRSSIGVEERNVSSLPNSQQNEDEVLFNGSSISESAKSFTLNLSSSVVLNWNENSPKQKSEGPEIVEPEDSVDVYDYDKENEFDPFNVPHYAQDIFEYYRQREPSFRVDDYLSRQNAITKSMRAILVDWMVEVQENFELNHETLYQAVKMTDLFLTKASVSKQSLQLVGTTALFIASKFDERCPPASDDFLYICDDAYTRKELLDMERKVLKTLQFDIGFPLSYRFLRRYAKTSKTSMETLTLARFILEMSLMDYELIQCSESLAAAGCLLLSFRMKNEGEWTPILRKYSGYTQEQVEPMMWRMHRSLKHPSPSSRQLVNIKTKYSHEIFNKVATIPLLDDDETSFNSGRTSANTSLALSVEGPRTT